MARLGVALDGARLRRWLRTFLADAARIEESAAAAADLNAAAAVFLLALGADQRADAVGLASYHVERIEACDLDVEPGVGVLVEELERFPRTVIPGAVDSPCVAADALQVRLQQPVDVGLVDLRRRRSFRYGLVRRQAGELVGLFLRGAFGAFGLCLRSLLLLSLGEFDFALRIGNGL